MSSSNRQTTLLWLATAALALFSLGLSLGRIYQVDEAQNLYMARIAVRGEGSEFYTSAALPLLALGWLTQHFTTSAAMFTCARLAFVLVFWLNLALMAVASGVRLGSRAGAWTVLGAATLAPLWDYGIEVRHENLLLAGTLGMWALGQPRARFQPWRFACVGFLAAILQFAAVKALLYTLPISLLVCALPTPTAGSTLARRSAAWLVGLAAGLTCARVLYAVTGLWQVYLASFRGMASGLQKLVPLSHTFALERLLDQTPLLLAATFGALGVVLERLRGPRWVADAWSSGVAEATLLLTASGAFLANPTPFPYNLLLLVPFAYLLVVRVVRMSLATLHFQRAWLPWMIGIVMFTHVLPFARASARHLGWSNSRQQLLMETAEALTDPEHDRVYDATGLVLTRKVTQHWWYLHSLNLPYYGTAEFPRLSKVLLQRPAAVLIRSYRTDWLPPDDVAFMQAHYVPLADDIWVLGAIASGDRTWRCLQSGRYAVQIDSDAQAQIAVSLDGSELRPGPVELQAGPHQLTLRGRGRAALVWLGPRLKSPPQLPQSSHKKLFVNWY